MRGAVLLFAISSLASAGADWLEWVEPVITPAEKKVYLGLTPAERPRFEAEFWKGKAIEAEEYRRRIETIDAKFGSDKRGSGANTDPGRVWLSLGAPNRVKRIPSSRIFVPMEIWYYDTAPGVINTELRLIFFQANIGGPMRLYAPPVDTIRVLLIPQASTRSMFGPNSYITESDIRKVLKTGPAEDEVISAAVSIAPGIKDTGNTEILSQIASPRTILRRELSASVRSRLIVKRPPLDVVETVSPVAGSQVDIKLAARAQREIVLEVLNESMPLYRHQLDLGYATARAVEYTHRLDLLAGSYRLLITVDGAPYVYALDAGRQQMGDIWRFDSSYGAGGRETPFEFGGRRLDPSPSGRYAAVALAHPGTVKWAIRAGTETLWRAVSTGERLAEIELPRDMAKFGRCRLEAAGPDETRSLDLAPAQEAAADAVILSVNANLAPARRYAFAGRQWLVRGELAQARQAFAASLAKGETEEAQVGLAQADALAGALDASRERLRQVLRANPNSFDALSVFAYVETRFEDYTAAAALYRRALALQDSAQLREALARLPGQ